jgi:hypothetical protein
MIGTELAARLGLRVCARHEGDPWCIIHRSVWQTLSWEVCDAVLDYLDMAERGMDLVAPILTDLITELVGDDGDGHEVTPGSIDDECLVCDALDRAEARLRQLDTPPNSGNERINLGGDGDE